MDESQISSGDTGVIHGIGDNYNMSIIPGQEPVQPEGIHLLHLKEIKRSKTKEIDISKEDISLKGMLRRSLL